MWYVLWTMTGKEEAARQMIREHVDASLYTRCAVPYRLKRHYHGGKSEIVKMILFPSYVFVETDRIEDFVLSIQWFPGLNIILHTDDFYCPIYKHEEYFLTKLINDHDVIDISEGYMVGDRVHVTSGPLVGQEGNIKKIIRRNSVAILEINLFGRRTEVRMGLDIIEKSQLSKKIVSYKDK